MIVILSILFGYWIGDRPKTQSSNLNYSTHQVYSNEYTVRGLMVQSETIEAQIKDPSLLKAQLRVTIIEACDAASDVKNPSPDVIMFQQENCQKG